MSSIKISNLPSQTTYTLSDIYPVVDYNFVQTSKMTLGQLLRNSSNVQEQPGQTNALNYANDAGSPYEFLRGTNASSAVGATYESYVEDSYNSTVMGSIGSYVQNGSSSNIIGTSGCYITGGGNRNNIFGGTDHQLSTSGNNNQIYGGLNHIFNGVNYNSAIMAGVNNNIGGNMEKGVIIGGLNNSMTSYGDISTIIGSQGCSTIGYKTMILGAEQCHVYQDARFSGIYGGYGNQLNNSNSQGTSIINSWSSTMEGSGMERAIIINSDSCSITGSSYSNKHASIIGSTNSGIGANKERAILLGLSAKTALYSATTQVENLHAHKVISNDVINVGGVSGTINVDLSLGGLYKFVLQGTSSVNFTNWREGAQYKFLVYNDGSHTISGMTISGGGTVYTKNGSLPNPTNNGRTLYNAVIMEGDIFLTEDLNYVAV